MFYRLSDLKRYNNIARIKSESLAEHQFYCALILLKLKKYLKKDFNYNILLEYLLIHDIGELYTGDLPHNVKFENNNLKNIIEEIENNYIKNLGFKNIVTEIENNKDYYNLFKLCDSLQVIQYANNEIKLGNNTDNIKNILKEAKQLSNIYKNKLSNIFIKKLNIKKFMEEL